MALMDSLLEIFLPHPMLLAVQMRDGDRSFTLMRLAEIRLIRNTGFHAPGDARQIRFIQGDPVRMLVARSDAPPAIFELSSHIELFDFNSGSNSR